MDNLYTDRFNSLKDCLEGLKRAKDRDKNDEFVLSGTIQKFNLTFDLSWKTMKDIITKRYQVTDFISGSPRDTLIQAKKLQIIDDDTWLEMLNLRNSLIHDYGEDLAIESYDTIINKFIPLFQKLTDRIKVILETK